MYIFIPLHIVNQFHRKSAIFLQNYHDYKSDIDFLRQLNKQEVKKTYILD